MPDTTSNADPVERLRIDRDGVNVSAILRRPASSTVLLVLAHGAGAGMEHPHLERLTTALAAQGIATLRYQFPYMEEGSRRPDRAPLLEQTVRAAVTLAAEELGDLPIVAGGRSMGARMTARAQATKPLPALGLVFFAFPLHKPVNLADPDPSLERASHLFETQCPMLFLAGTRDRLSRPHLIKDTVARTDAGTLHLIETADHSFTPTKKSGRDQQQVEAELASVTGDWIQGLDL